MNWAIDPSNIVIFFLYIMFNVSTNIRARVRKTEQKLTEAIGGFWDRS